MPPSDLKITSGLSLFDCQDHHAILGVPLSSDPKVIRRRYLKIARMLHPDSVAEGVDKQTASTLLSKLINPSYEFLSQPSQMEEYNILLKLVGQRYAQDMARFPLNAAEAQELLQSQDYESAYQTSIESLAQKQFSQLGQYLEVTSALSEVNLAYLYRQKGSPPVSRAASRTPSQASAPASTVTRNPRSSGPVGQAATAGGNRVSPGQSSSSPSNKVNHDLVDQYCRRAEELIAKACYLEAIRELKEVVEGNNPIDPNNSKVYTLLGNIYKDHMKQPVMAKPFYTRALRADPNNAQAKEKLSEITPTTPRPQSKTTGNASAQKNAAKEKKKSGLFGFLSRKK